MSGHLGDQRRRSRRSLVRFRVSDEHDNCSETEGGCPVPLESPRNNKSVVSTLFFHFFRPSHKPLSLACTSVLPHVFPYFGMLECDVPHRTSSNASISLLGAVERQLVMNLLWLESSIPTATMSSWVTKDGKKWGSYPLFPFGYMQIIRFVRNFDDALALLTRLHILSNNATTKLGLSPAFKSSMRQAITGGYIQTPLPYLCPLIALQWD